MDSYDIREQHMQFALSKAALTQINLPQTEFVDYAVKLFLKVHFPAVIRAEPASSVPEWGKLIACLRAREHFSFLQLNTCEAYLRYDFNDGSDPINMELYIQEKQLYIHWFRYGMYAGGGYMKGDEEMICDSLEGFFCDSIPSFTGRANEFYKEEKIRIRVREIMLASVTSVLVPVLKESGFNEDEYRFRQFDDHITLTVLKRRYLIHHPENRLDPGDLEKASASIRQLGKKLERC